MGSIDLDFLIVAFTESSAWFFSITSSKICLTISLSNFSLARFSSLLLVVCRPIPGGPLGLPGNTKFLFFLLNLMFGLLKRANAS